VLLLPLLLLLLLLLQLVLSLLLLTFWIWQHNTSHNRITEFPLLVLRSGHEVSGHRNGRGGAGRVMALAWVALGGVAGRDMVGW